MRHNFDEAFKIVIGHEGGYANDPKDPGGETKYGIAKKFHPGLDIKNLTLDEAKEIYRSEYWEPAGCNGLPYPEDLIVFDTAVNMGVSKARFLQKESTDWRNYLARRIDHYRALVELNPALSRFLKGWMNRVQHLQEYCERKV